MKTRIALTIFWLSATIIVANYSQNFLIAKNTNFLEFANLAMLSCKISFFSCFWVLVITQNDMIFGSIRRFFVSATEKFYLQENGINQARFLISEDLLKPIISCEICVGLNISFWVYAIHSSKEFILIDFLFLLSLTTLITITTSKLWQKTIEG